MDNQSSAPLESPFPEASKSDTPEPPVFKPAEAPKKAKNKLIPLFVFLLLLALGTAGYFGWQNYQMKLEKKASDAQPMPSPVVKVDETADWKTHIKSGGLLFKYPPEFILEERDKGFYVIVLEKDKSIPQAGISIDTRLSSIYSSYEEAITKSSENLIDKVIEEITRGVKISGTIGPGFGEGSSITKAVLEYEEYEDSIVIVETLNKSPYIDVFDQFLSTFTDSWDPYDVVEVVEDSVKKRICPDEWIVNKMPGTVTPSPTPQEYLIINAKREEIINYDLSWIKSNCSVKEPQAVY